MDRLVEAQHLADFINTEDLRRPDRREPPFAAADTIATPGELVDWLRTHNRATIGPVTTDELELAHRLRTALRRAVERGPGDEASDRVHGLALDLPLAVGLDANGRPRAVASGPGTRAALASLLADLVRLGQGDGWDRLKVCAAPDCRWAFVDHSRPGSGRWCSSRGCGNRDKTRRYRRRQARPDLGDGRISDAT